MANYVSGWNGDRMPDSLSNGDWGNSLSNLGTGGDSSGAFGMNDASIYDPGSWDMSGGNVLGTPAPDGMYEYGAATNPFSYDVNTGLDNGYSTYTDFQTPGNYSFSSADNRSLLNSADSDYRSAPTEESGNDFLKKYRDAVSPYQGFLKNPIVSTLMGLNPVTAALRVALGGPTSVGGFLGSMFSSNPIGKILGGLAGGQAANYATTGEFAPMNGSNVGSMLGGIGGQLSGAPYGGMLGSYIGGQLGGMSGNPGNLGTQGLGNFGDLGGNMLGTGLNNGIGGGLANFGLAYNTNRTLGNQINTLEGLFGQNSPYATQMRQQLERRDAAAGRRSQYGNREVELQAALAGNAAKLQPSLQQLYAQKNANTNLLVQSLLRNPNILSGLKEGWNGLQGLFSGGSNQGPFVGGGYQSGNEGMGD